MNRGMPNPFSRVRGGLILILLGVLFLLSEADKIHWSDWWAYFLIGLGGIFIVEAIARSFSPLHREHISGKLIAGLILIIIGGAHIFGYVEWWPLILIAVGLALLLSSFWHSGK